MQNFKLMDLGFSFLFKNFILGKKFFIQKFHFGEKELVMCQRHVPS